MLLGGDGQCGQYTSNHHHTGCVSSSHNHHQEIDSGGFVRRAVTTASLTGVVMKFYLLLIVLLLQGIFYNTLPAADKVKLDAFVAGALPIIAIGWFVLAVAINVWKKFQDHRDTKAVEKVLRR